MPQPANPTDAITLFVADDYPLYVEGLAWHVERDARIHLIGTAEDGATALEHVAKLQPDVVLIGYHLPGLGGTALIRAIHLASPATLVAVLGGIVKPELVHEAVALGARGYLDKKMPGPAIVEALARIGSGGPAFSPAAEACLVEAVRQRGEAPDALPSQREAELLDRLARGATSKEIAAELFVSEATVKTYLKRLYAKLSVRDRGAAVAEGMRRGWLA